MKFVKYIHKLSLVFFNSNEVFAISWLLLIFSAWNGTYNSKKTHSKTSINHSFEYINWCWILYTQTISVHYSRLTCSKVMFVCTFFSPGNPPPMSRMCMLNPTESPISKTRLDCSIAVSKAPASKQPLPIWKLVCKKSYFINLRKIIVYLYHHLRFFLKFYNHFLISLLSHIALNLAIISWYLNKHDISLNCGRMFF